MTDFYCDNKKMKWNKRYSNSLLIEKIKKCNNDNSAGKRIYNECYKLWESKISNLKNTGKCNTIYMSDDHQYDVPSELHYKKKALKDFLNNLSDNGFKYEYIDKFVDNIKICGVTRIKSNMYLYKICPINNEK
jgi:hypothetical protein